MAISVGPLPGIRRVAAQAHAFVGQVKRVAHSARGGARAVSVQIGVMGVRIASERRGIS
jgi:hypothetical protein